MQKHFGDMLKAARQEKGMSQKDLADALDKTRASVSQWETSRTKPAFHNLVKLGELLDLDPEELLTAVVSKSSGTSVSYQVSMSEDTVQGIQKGRVVSGVRVGDLIAEGSGVTVQPDWLYSLEEVEQITEHDLKWFLEYLKLSEHHQAAVWGVVQALREQEETE